MATITIPIPTLAIQQAIVLKIDSQMQILEGLRTLKAEAEKKIAKILADVWGVETFEAEES